MLVTTPKFVRLWARALRAFSTTIVRRSSLSPGYSLASSHDDGGLGGGGRGRRGRLRLGKVPPYSCPKCVRRVSGPDVFPFPRPGFLSVQSSVTCMTFQKKIVFKTFNESTPKYTLLVTSVLRVDRH